MDIRQGKILTFGALMPFLRIGCLFISIAALIMGCKHIIFDGELCLGLADTTVSGFAFIVVLLLYERQVMIKVAIDLYGKLTDCKKNYESLSSASRKVAEENILLKHKIDLFDNTINNDTARNNQTTKQ
ncbi:MAG: hypothetical protein IJ557_02625 [Bacteroidaceae bacterium]|nr:hypothetical protein [Bacteroidaceae bacterium]